MKLSITLLIVISLLGYTSSFSQESTQMKHWYFNGKQIEFTEASASVQELATQHQYTASCANGVYNQQGEVLFNVIDGSVYNRNGELIDYITDSNPWFEIVGDNPIVEAIEQLGMETNIVSVPGNCSKFYIIYSNFQFNLADGEQPCCLSVNQTFYYSVIDMSLNNGLGGFAPGQKDVLIDVPTDEPDVTWGMAVSRLKSNNTRNLYVAGGGDGSQNDKVFKLIIDEFGIGSTQMLYESGVSFWWHIRA